MVRILRTAIKVLCSLCMTCRDRIVMRLCPKASSLQHLLLHRKQLLLKLNLDRRKPLQLNKDTRVLNSSLAQEQHLQPHSQLSSLEEPQDLKFHKLVHLLHLLKLAAKQESQPINSPILKPDPSLAPDLAGNNNNRFLVNQENMDSLKTLHITH